MHKFQYIKIKYLDEHIICLNIEFLDKNTFNGWFKRQLAKKRYRTSVTNVFTKFLVVRHYLVSDADKIPALCHSVLAPAYTI